MHKKRATYHPTEPTTKTTADAADNDDDTMWNNGNGESLTLKLS